MQLTVTDLVLEMVPLHTNAALSERGPASQDISPSGGLSCSPDVHICPGGFGWHVLQVFLDKLTPLLFILLWKAQAPPLFPLRARGCSLLPSMPWVLCVLRPQVLHMSRRCPRAVPMCVPGCFGEVLHETLVSLWLSFY